MVETIHMAESDIKQHTGIIRATHLVPSYVLTPGKLVENRLIAQLTEQLAEQIMAAISDGRSYFVQIDDVFFYPNVNLEPYEMFSYERSALVALQDGKHAEIDEYAIPIDGASPTFGDRRYSQRGKSIEVAILPDVTPWADQYDPSIAVEIRRFEQEEIKIRGEYITLWRRIE